jgi:hypothetical protein
MTPERRQRIKDLYERALARGPGEQGILSGQGLWGRPGVGQRGGIVAGSRGRREGLREKAGPLP